jgi:hypothetical protein
MEEVYVMGHRLIVFLDHALPQHPEFMSSDSNISLLRDKSRQDLDWIRNRLEVVALRVDEEQMNQHILLDLEGAYENLLMDGTASPHVSEGKQVETEWEYFSGWTAMASENTLVWEEAFDVSFESDEVQNNESFEYDPDDGMYQDFDSDDDLSIISKLDEESIGVSHRVAIDEESNGKNSRCVTTWPTNGGDHSSVMPSPRLSPRKALSNLMTHVLKRPARQDPPGVYFSKINCFVAVHVQHYDDRLVGIKHREDKENETISTAPSDEEDNYPRRGGRFDEGRTRILDYSPPLNDSIGE